MTTAWSKRPFDPADSPIPYHWVILAAGSFGIVMSGPGQTIGVSAFTDILISVLHLSRINLSLAYMIGTIASSFILPFAGAAYDRWGARIVGVASGIGLGLVLYSLSICDYLVSGLNSLFSNDTVPNTAIAFTVITLLFLALRFSGQGVMTMVSRNMVMKWFSRRRGLASAVMGVCIGLVFSMLPRVYDGLINFRSWRWAWVVLATVTITVFTAVALAFFRDNPEECGLLPDGGPADDEADTAADPPREYTLSEAVKTPVFWIYNAALGLYSLHLTAFTFHVVSIFAEAGILRKEALSIFPKIAVLSVTGSIVVGYLADRIKLRYILLIFICGVTFTAVGMAMLITSPIIAAVFIIIGSGMASGPFGILSSMVWPKFYGRKHLGKISGAHMGILVFASAVGPYIYARSREAFTSYRPIAIIMAIIGIVIMVTSLWAHDPGGKRG